MIKLNKWSLIDMTSVFYSFDEDWKPIIWEKWFEEMILWSKGRFITSPKKFLSLEGLLSIQILSEKYSLIDIISHIVLDFKNKLEKEAWGEIDSILVWRPVKFNNNDKKLDIIAEDRLKESFLRAWFKNVEFQYEPVWAFNSYVNNNPKIKEWKLKVIVIDLWWWTSDFSIFNIENWEIEIIWNNWVYVWWDDIDKSLIYNKFSYNLWKWAKQKTMNWNLIDIPNHIFLDFSDKSKLIFFNKNKDFVKSLLPLTNIDDRKLLNRFYSIFWSLSIWYNFHLSVEDIKKRLSYSEIEECNFSMFEDSFFDTITRNEFNEIIWNEVEKIKKWIKDVLLQSWLNTVDKIIINWWTWCIRIIRQEIEKILGNWKILEWNNLSSVWYWLTLESYDRFK